MAERVFISEVDSTDLLQAAVAMHQEVFPDEFIARLGAPFLRKYYRVFAGSPHAVALIATTSHGELLGGLLGTLHPGDHYRLLTRRYGLQLAWIVVVQSFKRPSLARMLMRTRLKRYAVGVLRQFRQRVRRPVASQGQHESAGQTGSQEPSESPAVGDITHLYVAPGLQSRGVGSQLVRHYEEVARKAGVHRIDLVTLPPEEGGAGRFYERLGWHFKEVRVSKSGESFHLYEKWLGQ